MTNIRPQRSEYRQVADILRQEIENGTYPPGSMLPSEPQLAERFGVSRPTVNRGVGILVSEGLAWIERGRGTFVREIPPIARNATSRFRRSFRETGGTARGAFDAEVASLGFEPRSELIQVGQVTPPSHIAEILRLGADGQALIRKRQMFASTTPVQVATSYIPWELAEGTQLEQRDTGPGGTFSRLAERGHAPAHFAETIHVRTPDTEEAAFLRMADAQRVYAVTRTAWDAGGTPIEVTLHVMPTHYWTLTYEWPAEE